MSGLYDEMHNLSQLSKTLRFELQPIGKTQENFEKYILEKDEKKAAAYPFVKKYCDEVHKKFISEALSLIETDKIEKELENYYSHVTQKEIDVDKLDEIKKNLRNIICKTFSENEKYKDMLSEKMISVFVKDMYKDDEEAMKYINEFDKFSTYFVGYHQSRENIYSNEEKHTAIAYRLIDENLPTFKNNLKLYAEFAQVCQEQIKKIKEELGIDTNDFFTDIRQYSKCLTQEDIEKYNLAISGKSSENDKKIQGINEYINLYNQQNKDKKKLTKFKVLYKQILSDTNTESFVLDVIENDRQVIDTVKQTSSAILEIISKNEFTDNFKNIAEKDLEKIYINNDSITSFSKSVYGDWSYITRLLEANYDKNYNGKAKVGTEKYDENRDKELKKIKQISLNFIEQNAEEKGKIAGYFSKTIELLISAINNANKDFQSLSEKEYTNSSKDLQNDKESVEKIKQLLDSIKELQNFVKILIPKIDTEIDADFYNSLNYETLTEIIPVYNKIRNYLTKKPYSEEKIKLNFDCPTLLGGWPNENANLGIIFKKDSLFYLGIMEKNSKKFFKNLPKPQNDKDIIKKMTYLQAADPSKDVQNLMVIDGKTVKKNGRKDAFGNNTILEELKNLYLPENINQIRKRRSYSTQSANFNKKDLFDFIEYYKQRTIEYFDKHEFVFKKTEEYKNFGEFTEHINQQAYQILFQD
ncbi:MAG: type V CRISPR-associated protein Cas12a/Cpf1, partial [Candidatus Gastranaerophilales bacterium]|nr:type V CRISPR-associated protein Cas12a/Cpf1 [Candidatus Gastranaerophilales bacterium]